MLIRIGFDSYTRRATMTQPTTHTVPVPGGRVSVTDHGGPGEPMVLLHGFPDDSRIYDKLIPHLEARRAITLDFLGYGRSDRVASAPLPAGQRVAEVSAVIDALACTMSLSLVTMPVAPLRWTTPWPIRRPSAISSS